MIDLSYYSYQLTVIPNDIAVHWVLEMHDVQRLTRRMMKLRWKYAFHNDFPKWFPFVIGGFQPTARHCFFTHCWDASCYSLHCYIHCQVFYFDSLFPLLFRSGDCDFDAPLFLSFLLTLFSIVFSFDTLRLYHRKFDVDSSSSFNGLYLTFGLPDLVLL